MVIQNSINLTATGMVSHDGAGVFSGRTITGTTDFIDMTNGDGVAGNPTASIATNFEATGMHGWNGSTVQKGSSTVSSNGTTITLSVERSGGGDLTVIFSDGYYTWDTTPAATVTLTAGTDTVPVQNYVYLLQSTKVLTASTTSFPSEEHAKIAVIYCQSAASLQTQQPYSFQQWMDDVTETDDQGHITDITNWIRNQSSTWISGVGQTYTITTNIGTPDNVTIETATGVVLHLHENTMPAFSNPITYYVVNDNTTPFTTVTDLNALLTDSAGVSMSGRYFSLVLWGAVNQTTGDCKLYVNLPSGSYANESLLTEDPDKFANFTIPTEFRNTGFLIAQWDLRHQASSGGTWTSVTETDLRGLFPSITAGGSPISSSQFDDNVFAIFNDTDDTKKIAFNAASITTATTRTITMLDADIDLANVVQSTSTLTDNAVLRGDGGTRNAQTSTILISDNGEMTNPSQPCFLARLASDQNLATGDATEATVIYGTEIFDQNADFNNGTGVFTAPVTGRYQFNCSFNITGLTASHTAGTAKFVSSNRTVFWNGVSYAAVRNSANTARFTGGIILDMDAADTCSITITVSGGTKVVNIASSENTFSGALVC